MHHMYSVNSIIYMYMYIPILHVHVYDILYVYTTCPPHLHHIHSPHIHHAYTTTIHLYTTYTCKPHTHHIYRRHIYWRHIHTTYTPIHSTYVIHLPDVPTTHRWSNLTLFIPIIVGTELKCSDLYKANWHFNIL